MLGGVSSVLRIGMDSKSQLDGPIHTGVTPAHDLTLNNTRTGKFNFGIHTAATAVNDDLLPATGGQDQDEEGPVEDLAGDGLPTLSTLGRGEQSSLRECQH